MADCALAIGNMMLAAHSMGIGSCWLNQLPGLTHMPLIRELLNDLAVRKIRMSMLQLFWDILLLKPNLLNLGRMLSALSAKIS